MSLHRLSRDVLTDEQSAGFSYEVVSGSIINCFVFASCVRIFAFHFPHSCFPGIAYPSKELAWKLGLKFSFLGPR